MLNVWHAISQQLCTIEGWLQWITYTKPYVASPMVTWPMTSRDSKRSTVVTNSRFHMKTMHSTSIVTNKMSYCQFMMKFKCKLQRLFEMSAFRTYTGTKSRTPLIDRIVDDALLQTVQHVYQMLLQIVNVSQLRPINTVLHRTPHLVVHRVEVGAVKRP